MTEEERPGARPLGSRTRTKARTKQRIIAGAAVVFAVVAIASSAMAVSGWLTQNTATSRGQGVGGTVGNLTWSDEAVLTSSNAYVECTGSLVVAAPSLHFFAKNLGPGDYCVGAANLTYSGGTLPVEIAQSFYPYNHDACGYVYDSIEVGVSVTIGPALNGQTYSFGATANATLSPGETVAVTFAVGEWASSPESCEGLGFDYDVNVTGAVPGGDGP